MKNSGNYISKSTDFRQLSWITRNPEQSSSKFTQFHFIECQEVCLEHAFFDVAVLQQRSQLAEHRVARSGTVIAGCGKLYKARSRLYRSQILQANTHVKALAEIYVNSCKLTPLQRFGIHNRKPFSSSLISIFCQKFANCLLCFAKFSQILPECC